MINYTANTHVFDKPKFQQTALVRIWHEKFPHAKVEKMTVKCPVITTHSSIGDSGTYKEISQKWRGRSVAACDKIICEWFV